MSVVRQMVWSGNEEAGLMLGEGRAGGEAGAGVFATLWLFWTKNDLRK